MTILYNLVEVQGTVTSRVVGGGGDITVTCSFSTTELTDTIDFTIPAGSVSVDLWPLGAVVNMALSSAYIPPAPEV
jgi:hypothetical protein